MTQIPAKYQTAVYLYLSKLLLGVELLLKNLAASLKTGDNYCLRAIFEEHGKYCISRLTNTSNCSYEDAEDYFIDAILVLREGLISGKIEHLTNLRSYLFSVCRNMYLVKVAKEKRLRDHTLEISELHFGEGSAIDHFPYEETKDINEQMMKASNLALSSLDEKCRKIITYYYLEKRNMSEIAEILHFKSADVAKTIKSRCFKKLLEYARKVELSEFKD